LQQKRHAALTPRENGENIMTIKAVALASPHSKVSPLDWPVARILSKIGHFFKVGLEVFTEAQEQARKAHAKFPFAE
jgi:hypothetical protein